MSEEKEQIVSIAMKRGDLADVPQFALPDGISVRWYQPGDEAAWAELWQRADEFGMVAGDEFAREFGADTAALPRRQFYLIDASGAVIGTATAWTPAAEFDRDLVRVHWVAIAPDAQGNGLGKSLMTITLDRARELGYRGAYLITQDVRTAAIRLYLRFGFAPCIRSEEERVIWRDVRRRIAPSALDRLEL